MTQSNKRLLVGSLAILLAMVFLGIVGGVSARLLRGAFGDSPISIAVFAIVLFALMVLLTKKLPSWIKRLLEL